MDMLLALAFTSLLLFEIDSRFCMSFVGCLSF
jgi:hypothetical protein